MIVDGQPWPAYHRYLGGGASRVEINTDWPLYVSSAPFLVAHELYPGHHTEAAIKERRLYDGRGWGEHCVLPIHSPAILVAEGIAEERRAVTSTMGTPDQREGIQAFLEKRRPRFNRESQ